MRSKEVLDQVEFITLVGKYLCKDLFLPNILTLPIEADVIDFGGIFLLRQPKPLSSLTSNSSQFVVCSLDKISLRNESPLSHVLSTVTSIYRIDKREAQNSDTRLVQDTLNREKSRLSSIQDIQNEPMFSSSPAVSTYSREYHRRRWPYEEERCRKDKYQDCQKLQNKRKRPPVRHKYFLTGLCAKQRSLLELIFLMIFIMCLYFSPIQEYQSTGVVLNNLHRSSRVSFAIALNEVDLSPSISNKQQSINNSHQQHIQEVSYIRKNRRETPDQLKPTVGKLSLTSSSNNSQFQSIEYADTYLTKPDNPDEDSEGELKYMETSVSDKADDLTTHESHSTSDLNGISNYTTTLGTTIDEDGLTAKTLMESLFRHIDKQWKFAEVILIIVISAILNLFTIIGNIMVLISFKMDRSLQTVSNYFLLSLALADLLIGLISMPLYTLYLLLNYWPLGPLMCDIWLAIDYLNSNAAVLNMLIISFDRYFSVTRPLTYRAKRTTKHACLMISCAWILSLTIWTPAIFIYPRYKSRTVQGLDKCEIEFVKANTYLTFVTAILAFYIPVAIMIYLYWRIWLETKKRYRDLTTLFLVSGVGAAAPVRATRPPLLTQGSSSNKQEVATYQQRASAAFKRQLGAASNHEPATITSNSKKASALAPFQHSNTASRSASRASQALTASSVSELEPTGSITGGPMMRWPNEMTQNAQNKQQQQQQANNTKMGDAANQLSLFANLPNVQLTSVQQNPYQEQLSKREQQYNKSFSPTSVLECFPSSMEQEGKCRCACCLRNSNLKLKKVSSKCLYRTEATSSTCNSSRCIKRAQLLTPTKGECQLCFNDKEASKSSIQSTRASHIKLASESAGTVYNNEQTKHNNHLEHCQNRACQQRYHQQHIHQHHHPHHHRQTQVASSITSHQINNTSKRSMPNHYSLHNFYGHRLHHHHHHHNHHHHYPHHSHHHHHHRRHHHHHHHHHHHSRQQHHHHRSAKHRKCIPDCAKVADDYQSILKQQAKVSASILSSGYQLLSGATNNSTCNKSRSCASILRKVHPSANFSTKQAFLANCRLNRRYLPIEVGRDNISTRYTSISCISLPCVSKAVSEIQTVNEQAEKVTSIDETAIISKIDRPSSAHNSTPLIQYSASPKPLRIDHEVADEEDLDDEEENDERDFETRIVSAGNKFRFESDHLKADSLSPIVKSPANESFFVDALAKQQQQQAIFQVSKSDCYYCCRAESRCCSKIKIYSTQCCLCTPSSRYCHGLPIDHTSYSTSTTLRSPTDCKQCEKLLNLKAFSSSSPTSIINKRTINNSTKPEKNNCTSSMIDGRNAQDPAEEAALELANNARLPILGALQKASERLPLMVELGEKVVQKNSLRDSWNLSGSCNLEQQQHSSSNPQTKDKFKKAAGKKFSQKLTFSDILVAADKDSSSKWTSGGESIKKYSSDGTPSFAELSIPKELYFNECAEASESNKKSWLARLSRANSLADFGSKESKGSRLIHIFRTVLCCPGEKQMKANRFSSNDSSSHKNSSSEDSETTANHTRSFGGNKNNQASHVPSTSSKSSYSSHHPIQPKSERKAAKTLSTLLLVFIITWLPYNILVLIKTLSGVEDQVPEKIWNFSYYLCYINSTINPLCYALCNAQFRRTYMRILKCKLSNEHNSTRRLVPLQSSTNWNKDLRIATNDSNDTNFRHNSQQLSHHRT